MREIKPATETIICDKCGSRNPRYIDATGKVTFIGRDWSGAGVGGVTKEFELCSSCTSKLKQWFGEA